MSDKLEIDRIRSEFAQTYSIDLGALREDTAKLQSLIRSPQNSLINSVSIYADGETYTAGSVDAQVPDLETAAFQDLPTDDRISPRKVEQNLDEALRYVQSALQVRNQYGELAKLRNDTRLKGEEFIRLDLIHLEEVDAGLYKLPWQDAADDKSGLEITIAKLDEQRALPEEMLRQGASGKPYSGVLTPSSIDSFVKQSSQITRDTANTNKADVYDAALETGAYRSSFELATWESTLASISAASAQLQSKLVIARRKEDYLRKDEGFRSNRAAVSRQIAWAQLNEHCRAGSVLNYDERLTRQKELFVSNLICLAQRITPLAAGLNDFYGVKTPFVVPKPGSILDYAALWLVEVQSELLKTKREQRVTVSSFWCGKPALRIAPSGNVGDKGGKITATVVVDSSVLPPGRRLLRGASFEYLGNRRKPITLDVMPPAGAFEGTSSVRFGRVCEVSSSIELKPQHADIFWNGDASGTWTIEIRMDDTTDTIEDLGMHIWTAS
ncbi:hypothetical protein [Mesorhizobium sp. BHbdii]